MRNLTFPSLLLAGVLLAAPAHAEPTLTLDAAWSLASDRNLQLVIARHTLERSQAGIERASAANWPGLSIGSDLNQGLTPANTLQARLLGVAATPGATALDAPSTHLGGSVSTSYTLDTNGERGGRIRVAEGERRVAGYELRQLSQQLRLEVAQAYYDLQAAQQAVRITAIEREQTETTLHDAQALMRGGLATVFDVQRAEVERARSRQDQLDAERALRVARRRIARLLNLDEASPLQAADTVAPVSAWQLGFEQSLQQALRDRPELQAQDTQRTIAEEQAKLALAALGARTQLFASADALSMLQPGGGSPQALGGLGPGAGYTVGARLQWALFDGGAARAGAREAELAKAIAEARAADLKRAITLEVESAYAQYEASREKIGIADRAVETAQAGLASARMRFKAGEGTSTDVILAQSERIRAEQNRINTILDYNRAIAALERACLKKELPEPH